MLQTYKAGKFAVQAIMPSKEEYALLSKADAQPVAA
jgi:hypothetical protein